MDLSANVGIKKVLKFKSKFEDVKSSQNESIVTQEHNQSIIKIPKQISKINPFNRISNKTL